MHGHVFDSFFRYRLILWLFNFTAGILELWMCVEVINGNWAFCSGVYPRDTLQRRFENWAGDAPAVDDELRVIANSALDYEYETKRLDYRVNTVVCESEYEYLVQADTRVCIIVVMSRMYRVWLYRKISLSSVNRFQPNFHTCWNDWSLVYFTTVEICLACAPFVWHSTVPCNRVHVYTKHQKMDMLHLCTCFTVLAFDGSPCEGADDLLVDLGVSTKNCYRSELVVDWSVVRHSSNLHLRLTFVYNENDSLTGQNIVGFYSYVFR